MTYNHAHTHCLLATAPRLPALWRVCLTLHLVSGRQKARGVRLRVFVFVCGGGGGGGCRVPKRWHGLLTRGFVPGSGHLGARLADAVAALQPTRPSAALCTLSSAYLHSQDVLHAADLCCALVTHASNTGGDGVAEGMEPFADAAVDVCRHVVAVDPGNTHSALALAMMRMFRNEHNEAGWAFQVAMWLCRAFVAWASFTSLCVVVIQLVNTEPGPSYASYPRGAPH